ncbi:hypothetical protein CHS0354_042916 [Potamilus streckersoni]|uniref:ZZ-type domain-containing protein n=1 Tax=Potamilus streckersoni TaxID=2493646 RepID=A0AAE0T4X9_9BIVA|nr:hypothetical protein CHS0354_042916 [Potamilus streckersoni]
MSLIVNVFLQKSRSVDEEIRRFSGPADVSITCGYLYRRISDILPSLRHGRFSLYWKNSDRDLVALSTNEELFDALGFVKDGVLKIYVREKASNVGSEDAKAQLHPRLTCDGCNEDIIGSLFMCMECPDYDLCSKCETIGIHKEHDMVRLTSPMETECCAESLAGHPNLEFPSKSHEPEHGASSVWYIISLMYNFLTENIVTVREIIIKFYRLFFNQRF